MEINIWSEDGKIHIKQSQNNNLRISIYNLLGQEIANLETNQKESIISVDGSEFIYIIKIIEKENSITKKIFIK